jgi:hypothetical protein
MMYAKLLDEEMLGLPHASHECIPSRQWLAEMAGSNKRGGHGIN